LESRIERFATLALNSTVGVVPNFDGALFLRAINLPSMTVEIRNPVHIPDKVLIFA
jgi:hypothetical protein